MDFYLMGFKAQSLCPRGTNRFFSRLVRHSTNFPQPWLRVSCGAFDTLQLGGSLSLGRIKPRLAGLATDQIILCLRRTDTALMLQILEFNLAGRST